jgi:hypothetical protein
MPRTRVPAAVHVSWHLRQVFKCAPLRAGYSRPASRAGGRSDRAAPNWQESRAQARMPAGGGSLPVPLTAPCLGARGSESPR